MDFDQNSVTAGGMDGCIDFAHPSNHGLPEDVWCDDCVLTGVFENYSDVMSRADFWVAAAHAVIRLSSNNALDLKSEFTFGRLDTDSCPESGPRLPLSSDCTEVEGVFLDRLGLTLTDAVALLGAHTIGRGDAAFSGHHGIWVDTDAESVVSLSFA